MGHSSSLWLNTDGLDHINYLAMPISALVVGSDIFRQTTLHCEQSMIVFVKLRNSKCYIVVVVVVGVVHLEHSHSFIYTVSITIPLRRDPLRVDVADLQGMQ